MHHPLFRAEQTHACKFENVDTKFICGPTRSAPWFFEWITVGKAREIFCKVESKKQSEIYPISIGWIGPFFFGFSWSLKSCVNVRSRTRRGFEVEFSLGGYKDKGGSINYSRDTKSRYACFQNGPWKKWDCSRIQGRCPVRVVGAVYYRINFPVSPSDKS